MFQFLITSSVTLPDVIEDLERVMLSKEKSGMGKDERLELVIANPLAFESYLYWIRKHIDLVIIGENIKRKDKELIKKSFELLKSISESSEDSNKYYYGKSLGLVELTEYLFCTTIKSEKYSKDTEKIMMQNRRMIVEEYIDPLLDWLKNSLPYHTETNIIKKYLRIIPSLAYSIREADSNEISCIFLSKYLEMFQDIVSNEAISKRNRLNTASTVSQSRDSKDISLDYFTINSVGAVKDFDLKAHEFIDMTKSTNFLEGKKNDNSRLSLRIKIYFRIMNNPQYHVISITKLSDVEIFVLVKFSRPDRKNASQCKSHFLRCDTKYSVGKCTNRVSWTNEFPCEGWSGENDKVEEKCNRVVLMVEMKLSDPSEFKWVDIQFHEKDKCKVTIDGENQDKFKDLDLAKNKSKELTKRDKDISSKRNEAINFVKHFDSPKQKFTTYMFPYFFGDIALCQVFLKKSKKQKKTFMGIFRRNKNNKSVENEFNSDPCNGLCEIKTYSQFLRHNIDHMKENLVFSIYPRNIELYMKYILPKFIGLDDGDHLQDSENLSLSQKSMLQNFILKPCSESIIEFGISQNNNLILPLIDWIDSNEKTIIETLYEAILKFNTNIKEYPQYEEYLILHTDYNIGLQQTYLKVYENKQILWQFLNEGLLEWRFIDQPPLMFYINLIKLMMYKDNIITHRKYSVKSSSVSMRISESKGKDSPRIEKFKDLVMIITTKDEKKIEDNLALLFNLYYDRNSYWFLK